MVIIPNYKITEHFKYSDISCKHCGELIIGELLYRHMSNLESLRQECGFPFIIDSGHRCPVHNKNVRGELRSWHLKFATDVRPERQDFDTDATMELKLHTISELAEKHGFMGIGTYDVFRHLDCRPDKVRWEG
jgi:hypothetical protein